MMMAAVEEADRVAPGDPEEAAPLRIDPRLTLQKLEVFCRVVDAGGVGKAAEQLYLSQPVITSHVRSLEERLGVKLFQRQGRNNVLTPGGERTYHWGREILRNANELTRELKEIEDGTGGSIHVSATMSAGSYLLAPIVARLAQERPNLRLSLMVSDRASAEEAVQLGDADFAVAIGEPPAPADWRSCEEIGQEELLVVMAPGQTEKERLTPAEVAKLRFVEGPMSGRRELAERRLREAGVPELDIAVELGHPEALKQAVTMGAGATVLFRTSVETELANGSLVGLSVTGADLVFPVLLVTRTDKNPSTAQRELIGRIRKRVTLGAPPVQSTPPAEPER